MNAAPPSTPWYREVPPDGVEQPVILSLFVRRAVLAALAATTMTWSGSHAVSAQAPAANSRVSASGNFLAARHATNERDAAAAAAFYRSALKVDPKNTELLDRTFLSVLANGDVDEAVRLARTVLQVESRGWCWA